MEWNDYDAVLFDLDGVITVTALVHMRAWEELFRPFLEARGSSPAYAEGDYFAYIDGKPRYAGVRAMLAARHIELPEGAPGDSPDADTVHGLGNRKNEVFAQLLEREGVQSYAGSVQLLDELANYPLKLAVVSSSRNAPAVIEAAGLTDRFDIIVDGVVAVENHLPGKPAPDTFAFAARELGTTNARSIVFEDAISGVEAGHRGEFGMVIGVNRGAGADKLTAAGADLVVDDLAELVST